MTPSSYRFFVQPTTKIGIRKHPFYLSIYFPRSSMSMLSLPSSFSSSSSSSSSSSFLCKGKLYRLNSNSSYSCYSLPSHYTSCNYLNNYSRKYTTSSSESTVIQQSKMSSSSPGQSGHSGHGNVLLRMNEIQDNPGSTHAIKRVGRGIGSGRGKTSTRGMNGQRKRAGFNLPVGFEGGQTPIQKKMPKLAEKNNAKKKTPYHLSVGDLQMWISMGRISVPTGNRMLTMKDIVDSGRFPANAIKDGLKLVTSPECGEWFRTSNLHIEVTDADPSAIQLIEEQGGTVTCAHFNDLALRVHLHPDKFTKGGPLPRRARPPPKLMPRYLDYSLRGYLSPEVQYRNRKLLGYVTSDKAVTETTNA